MAILLSVIVTLLLLRNNCIFFHQFSNFIQSLSNHPGSGTILLGMTVCSLCTASADAIDIISILSISVILYEASSLVILNDPCHSNNILILLS